MSGSIKGGDLLSSAELGMPVWSGMAATGYTNSWSDFGGSNDLGQYRKWAQGNQVEITGTLAHGSVSGNSAFFTLPAGYQPATAQVAGFGATQTGAVVSITVSTAGVLTAVALPAGTTTLQFTGVFYLDA